MALTDAALKAAKPKDKPYKLFDGSGLYLEVAPGGGRWWRFKYRHGGRDPSLPLAFRIADAFGRSVEQVFDKTDA